MLMKIHRQELVECPVRLVDIHFNISTDAFSVLHDDWLLQLTRVIYAEYRCMKVVLKKEIMLNW